MMHIIQFHFKSAMAVKQVKFKLLHTTTWLTIYLSYRTKEMNIQKDPEIYNDNPCLPVFERTATNKKCLYSAVDIV